MDIFELDTSTVQQLQAQGFNLVEKANAIFADYFYPNCDTPPTLEWEKLTTGVHLLIDEFESFRENEVNIIFQYYFSF